MDLVRKLIYDKLLEHDLAMDAVSKQIGRNETYLQQFLKKGSPRELRERERRLLAEILKVPEDDLRGPSENLPKRNYGKVTSNSLASATAHTYHGVAEQKIIADPQLIGSAADLPVYGTESAQNTGEFVVTVNPVDWAARPPMLARVQDAYGLIVPRKTMEPVIRAGTVLMINPHLPPREGDICVFRSVREGVTYIMGGEFRGETNENWKVRHYNPARDFVLKKTEWRACHRSVGAYFP